jgi:hypothetical protein
VAPGNRNRAQRETAQFFREMRRVVMPRVDKSLD